MIKVFKPETDFIPESMENLLHEIKKIERNEVTPTLFMLQELESQSKCIRETITQKLRQETGYMFNELSQLISNGPIYNKEVMNDFLNSIQYLNCLNDIDIRLREVGIKCLP